MALLGSDNDMSNACNSLSGVFLRMIYLFFSDRGAFVRICKLFRIQFRNPMQVQKLEDAIQEVFYELIKKSDTLMKHENIAGWLVVTLRLKLKEQYKKKKRDDKWSKFSLNEDHVDVAIREAEQSLNQQDALKIVLEKAKIQQLEEFVQQIVLYGFAFVGIRDNLLDAIGC